MYSKLICLVNVFLTPSGILSYNRGNLSEDDKVEVFKYTLYGLSCINSWSDIFIYCKLDDCYKDRQSELKSFIESLFKQYRLHLHFWRNEYQSQWQESCQKVLDLDDPTVLFLCNHDHIFLDSNLDIISNAERELGKNNEYPYRSFYLSHWPEMSHHTYIRPHRHVGEHFIAAKINNCDSVQIVTKPVLEYWWFKHDYGNRIMGRTDTPNGQVESTEIEILVPFKEVFRHYDGYGKTFLNVVPAINIPPNFWDHLTVRYGYNDRDNECVNINPTIANYYDVDSSGTDYKYLLDELPLIFQQRNPTIVANNICPKLAKAGRDEGILRMLSLGQSDINSVKRYNNID